MGKKSVAELTGTFVAAVLCFVVLYLYFDWKKRFLERQGAKGKGQGHVQAPAAAASSATQPKKSEPGKAQQAKGGTQANAKGTDPSEEEVRAHVSCPHPTPGPHASPRRYSG